MAEVEMRMELTGVNELLHAFDKLQIDVEEAVAASLLASAFVVSNDAKRRAPHKTGNLARSITPGVGRDPVGTAGGITQTMGVLPEQSVSSLKSKLVQTGESTAYVATNVVYAPPQEYLYDHPYLRPALEENKGEVERHFEAGLRQVIAKAGR